MLDDRYLMLFRNRPAADPLQCRRIHGFDAKGNCVQSGAMEQIDEFLVQVVQARLALEFHLQVSAQDSFRDSDSPLAFLRKERITENQIRLAILPVNEFDLIKYIFSGP